MIAPCDNIKVEDVWVKQFPKLLTESAFRTVDVNSDGIEDVIFGYATGITTAIFILYKLQPQNEQFSFGFQEQMDTTFQIL